MNIQSNVVFANQSDCVRYDEFEFNVSKYSTAMLYKAEHTDELKTDGKVHLRIDYKVSGIGSNSCGPALNPKYQVNDKKIYFCFSVCF